MTFVNSDSGEGYIVVDGNEGDRNNLTLWHSGDALMATVTSQCKNTVVVIHSVGAVNIETFYDNPNVTAILWAGLPGQESGDSIVDILIGKKSPGRLPFTIGTWRGSYGADVLYTPNNGVKAPQQYLTEGIFTDYRGFDANNETPIYEFGHGLSWTTFGYLNLQITPISSDYSYSPVEGHTPAAPTYGTISNDSSRYLCVSNMSFVKAFIYPCLNSTNFANAGHDPEYGTNPSYPSGAYNSSAQSYLPAGRPPEATQIFTRLFTVTATITNIGDVTSDEVPQLYVGLGGPNDAPNVLRGSKRITIAPRASATFTVGLTRRDISNWSPEKQNWSAPRPVN